MDDTTKLCHPSFGMIGASRVSGSGSGLVFYGSRIRHPYWVEITLRESHMNRNLGRDWFFGGKELCSVRLTEAQWASFVASMNVGFGVCCTIDHVNGVEREDPPEPADSITQAKSELKADMSERLEKIQQTVSKLQEAVDTNEGKKVLRSLVNELNNVIQSLPGTVHFAQLQFEEHVEHVTTDARASMEAHFLALSQKKYVEGGFTGPREIESNINEL